MTPLLFLLDAILSQDAARTETALEQIQELVQIEPLQDSPLRSARALESIVSSLMMHHPHLAQVASSNDRSLPLHFAASIGNTRVSCLLLEKHRQGALTPNSKGKIPLHYAAREGRTEMVKHMLHIVPEAAAVLSTKGKLALHFAAGEGHIEVCRALLKVHPEGASIPSKKGKLAIHFAARWGHIIVARDLQPLFPNGVSTLDDEGSLPLHDATREGQSEMAAYLVGLYPEGLSKVNLRGETPLFPAIRSGNFELCTSLVYSWPQGGRQVIRAVGEEDDVEDWEDGLLELCLRGAVDMIETSNSLSKGEPAKENSFPTTAMDPVAQQQPNSSDLDINLPRSKSPALQKVKRRKKRSALAEGIGESPKRARSESDGISQGQSENKHFLPLHAALECEASSPVLNYLLDKYPNHLGIRDKNGMLPLHLAIQHGSPATLAVTMEKIWKPYKEACSMCDSQGRLPLHLALKARSDCLLVRSLLDSNPSAVDEVHNITDPDFVDTLPLLMAAEYECELTTVFMLTREDPSVLKGNT